MTELTWAEEIIMKAIWTSDKVLTCNEIKLKADNYGYHWKRQTVSTFLLHLREKQFVQMIIDGRSAYYTPLVTMDDYRMYVLRNHIDFFFENNVVKFVEYVTQVDFSTVEDNSACIRPDPSKLSDVKRYLIEQFTDLINSATTEQLFFLITELNNEGKLNLINKTDKPDFLLTCDQCEKIFGSCRKIYSSEKDTDSSQLCVARFRQYYG